MPGVVEVVSPTNVPLFTSDAKAKFRQRVLTDPEVDLAKARDELTGSELYRNQLVSADGTVLNLVVRFESRDPESLRRSWRDLRDELAAQGAPDAAQLEELERRRVAVLSAKADERALHLAIVRAVRAILPRYRERGAVAHASGLPALSVDMVDYLERDIRVFGVAVTVFLFLTLLALFRRPRFVVLPLLTCVLVVVSVLGGTVAAGVETTVVTSNISSLLFIIGMAHSIHFVVKYREERALHPERPYRETLWAAVHGIWEPCLYTALTTCVGFASLLTADIGPVKEFAVAMAIGTMVAFGVSLVFLPATFALLPPTVERAGDVSAAARNRVLAAFAGLALRRRPWVYGACVLLVVAAGVGITLVRIEQRFIDYFRADTEVHQGLAFIDRVGGTMTLEVVLRGDRPGYWLEEENYARVAAVHDWFEALPQTGKTLSLVSLRKEGSRLIGASPMAGLRNTTLKAMMAIFGAQLGRENVRKVTSIVATEDFRTTRVYVRLRETVGEVRRADVIDGIRDFLAEDPRLAPEREKPAADRPAVTGMFLLFTNMLASLVGSQVSSLAWVVASVGFMLIVLFRHAGVGLLAMPPNLLPIALVLGTMGWVGIALDLMTIMIASISLGMAVDSSIHYVVRFRQELRRTGDWEQAVVLAHQSIGKAILYTAVTVIAGFLILVLSRFTPTIWFGLLTAVAMGAGLVANLILLPSLLLTFRPYRRDARAAAAADASASSSSSAV